MERRTLLAALAGTLAAPARAASGAGAGTRPDASAGDDEGAPPLRLGAAWRGPAAGDPHHVGLLEVDWTRAQVRVRHAVQLPSRPHGLLAEADSVLLAVALRPGTWLLRLDAEGRVAQRVTPDDDGGGTRYGGHVVASPDGRVLYTTETRTVDGSGRIGVRDARTLRKLDEWSTHGIEPHQLLVDGAGHLVVANGGIRRGSEDRKIEIDRMDSSLVHLDGASGALRGQWRLPDARLSIRHLAWSRAADAQAPLLGLALQAEHDDRAQRAQAPALALWDGREVSVPTRHAAAEGYAGDIAPAANGGFVISNAKLHHALLWQPQRPHELTVVAQLQQAYALAGWPDAAAPGGVLISAARGIGRWHPSRAPALVPWPQPMALDNHWVAWS